MPVVQICGDLGRRAVPRLRGEVVRPEQLSGVLSEFARTMVTDFPIQGILDHLVERIVEIMPVTGAGVTLIAPDRQPRYIAASDPSALRFEKLQTETGRGSVPGGLSDRRSDLRAGPACRGAISGVRVRAR